MATQEQIKEEISNDQKDEDLQHEQEIAVAVSDAAQDSDAEESPGSLEEDSDEL